MLTVGGAMLTVLAIALSLLSFAVVNIGAATTMPSVSDMIPGEDGTSALTLPEGGNVDTNDVLTPDDTTRTPTSTVRPEVTSRPGTTTAPDGTGTDTGMLEEDGDGILGAIIAVIVVVAIILVVIALLPRKKR